MRILLLSQWYLPEPVTLPADMAEILRSMGHEIQVLTGFPNHPSGKLYEGYPLQVMRKDMINGVPVIRLPLYPDHSRSGLKRMLNYTSLAISTALLGLWVVKRPHVILVYYPPLTLGLTAWILSRLWGVPYVLNIQDMWPETLKATGMVKSEKILKIVGYLSNWVYGGATKITVISPGFRANVIGKGVAPEKVHVVYDWVNTDHYRPMEPDQEQARQLGLSGRFNLMYTGTIGAAQGLDAILDAANRLRDLPEVQFVLIGDGVDLPRLRERAVEMELTNVLFLGRYPSESMPEMLALADVLLLHLKDDPLFRITVPQKVFTYLATGKPILAAVTGDAADVVTSAGAGLSCEPGNAEALAATVRELINMSNAQRDAMGAAGRQAACERYSSRYLIGEIERLMQLCRPKRLRLARRGYGR